MGAKKREKVKGTRGGGMGFGIFGGSARGRGGGRGAGGWSWTGGVRAPFCAVWLIALHCIALHCVNAWGV